MSHQLLLLANIEINGWRSISNANINFLSNEKPRMRTILLGENGSGKTSILRAIALSTVPNIEATALAAELIGTQRRKNKSGKVSKSAEIKATFVDPTSEERFSVITRILEGPDGQEKLERSTVPDNFPWERIVAAGYGVGRGIRGTAEIGQYDRRKALLSLFKDDAPLFDAESVLKSVALERTTDVDSGKGKTPFPTLQYFKRVIRKLFRLNPNHDIEVGPRGVLVHGPWGAQPFHALGDGYRSTAGWVLDFLGRFWSAHLAGLVSAEPAGIVLVDEVDEHLHPSWSRDIFKLLTSSFPAVQFITTTHSPIPISRVNPEELILIEQKNTISTIYQNLPDTSTKTVDSLLRGQWFGLNETMDEKTEKLLKEYQKALRSGDVEIIFLSREKLQNRAPSLVGSPLEEAAVHAAQTIRSETNANKTKALESDQIVASLRQSLRNFNK